MERQFQEIQALVLQGESERLEFKKSTGQLSRAGETICAFLNNHGGIVLIGVDDQGNIVGQMISDSTQQEIAHLVIGHLSPHPEIHIQYVDIPDSTLKVILLEASEHANEKPYTFHHKPYYRVQSTNKIMEQPQYHQLLLNRQRQPVHWDALINTRCTLEQLDQDRIYEVVNFGIRNKRLPAQLATRDVGEILDKLGLRENGQLNNAAVVLFCKDMLPIFVQCILKMAALRGNSKRDFIDLQQIHGNFFDLLEKAEEFVGRHTSIAAHFVQNSFQRVDVPDYPPLAVREALINALCHRDYSHPGGSIAMSLFSDRLEINNMGRLSPELSFELLRTEHTSVPRNAKIADVLFRCAYIEKIGTGTQEIIQLCDEAHMPPPEFGEQGGFFCHDDAKSAAHRASRHTNPE